MRKLFLFLAAMLITCVAFAEDQYPQPTTSNSLAAALNAVGDGETVWLDDATPYVNHWAESGQGGDDYTKLRYGKHITIRAIEGKSPIIQLEVPFQVREAVNAKFIGVKFDGSSLEHYSHLFDMNDATDNVLEFENCEFTNIAVYTIRIQKAKKLKKVSFTNCYIHDNSNRVVLNEKGETKDAVVTPGGTIEEIIVKDSKFESITSYPLFDNYDDDNHTSGGSLGSITITGCEFTGLDYPVLQNCKAAHIGKCVIDDCYFHDNKRTAVYIQEPIAARAQVDDIAVTNSTFANYTDQSGYYASIIDVRNKGSQTALGKVLVDHCTFYNCKTINTDHVAIRVHKSTDATVSNCIFYDPNQSADDDATKRAATNLYGGNVKNCIAYNYLYGTEGHIINGATFTSCSQANPRFKDAANADFSLTLSSPALAFAGKTTAGNDTILDLGDPRWWPKAYWLKNPWDGSTWTIKRMDYAGAAKFKLENVVFGGQGVNNNTDSLDLVSGGGWIAVAQFLGDKPSRLDTVTLEYDGKTDDITCTILGEFPKVAAKGDWDSWAKPLAFVIAGDEKTASVTKHLAAGDYGFKMMINGDFKANGYTYHREYTSASGITENGSNMKLTADIEGDYTFTWTFETNAISITFPEPPVPAKFYITGSDNLVGEELAWHSDAIKVTEDSYTFTNLPAGNYQMKIVDGENWLGFSALTEEGRAVELFTNQTGDVCFTLAEAGDITVTYKAGEVFKVEGTFALPTVQLIGIKGEGEAAWDAEHNAVTLVPAENKLTASATITLSGNREFKVICADAWLGKVTEGDEYVLNREVTSVNGLVYGENIPAIIIAPDMLNEEYTFTWTYATGELSVAFPALPKFYITGDAALVGVEKAWHADAIKVTEDSYTFEDLPAGAYKLKVTLDGTWEGTVKGVDNLTVRPAGIQDLNGNIGFILAEAGDVTVTYTAETFTVEGAFVNTPIYMTYFATTGWAGDDASSAVWDATNEKIDVTIAQVKEAQWQGQVWFQSGKPSQADKLYDVSLKIKANKNIGGVIAKYQNGDLTIFSESFNLEADVAYELEMTDQIGKADGDGFLIFDFGYAPAETSIEIYDIEIVEKDAPVLPDLADGFYLIGRINGEEAWNIYGLVPNSHFAPNPGTPEFMLDTTLAIGDEIQVVNVLNKAITAWFPGGDGNNFVIDAWHAGQKTIYFRPDKAGGDDWHHGCIYIAPNEPEVTYSNFEIDLRNGQLGTDGVNMQKYLTVGDEYVYSDEMPLAYNAVLKAASYNGNQHGYIAFVATIPVTAGIYKITLGNCQYNIGTDKPAASVKNEADNALTLLDKYGHSTTAISAIDDCYHNGTTTHITSAWLVVKEAQTIKIVGAKYTPYIKVQKVESVPGLVNVVKFANDEDAEGILPDEQIVEPGESITLLAVNRLLYKAGHTLTGWTDGVETYQLGAEFTPTDHTILTAVYSENGANLLTATHDVTVQWDFTKTDGAPAVNWQNREDDFIVTQAIVGGARLDVKLDINTKNNGKFAPTIYWCQVNPVTTFTFPSKKDATLEVFSYQDPAASTLDENAYTGSWTSNIATFSTTNVSGTSVYVSKEVNQYYRYFKLTLPASAATAIDNTGADEKAVKVIENGQILIIKNGKTFNILGAEVK